MSMSKKTPRLKAGRKKGMALSRARQLSIIESALFASSKPMPARQLLDIFDGSVTEAGLQAALAEYQKSLLSEKSGLFLRKAAGGFQLCSKAENKAFTARALMRKPLRLSRPALEALTALAYLQPCPRHKVDEVRGADSSHLFRSLMEAGLMAFAGKSDLPGRPSLYKTTKRFLEVFGLNSLKDLPSQEEVQKLMPSDLDEDDKAPWRSIAARPASSFEEDENERGKIQKALEDISVEPPS